MSTGEKFCTGKNCLASAENNYAHSDECLAEYELAINSSPATSPQSMQAALQIIAEKDARIAELLGAPVVQAADDHLRDAAKMAGLHEKCDGDHAYPRCADPDCWNDVRQAVPGLEVVAVRAIVTDALVSMIEAVTGLKAPADIPLPDFIQAAVDRATDRINSEAIAGYAVRDTRIAELQLERDEADRRAGSAERRMLSLQETISALNWWRDKQKEAAGYRHNESFDTVWADTLARAKERDHMADLLHMVSSRGLSVTLTEDELERIDAALAGCDG